MAEPLVFGVVLRRTETQRIAVVRLVVVVALHPLRTRRLREDGLHRILLEDSDAVLADTEVHQHLIELELVVRRGPETCAGGREDMRIVVGTLLPAVFDLNPRRLVRNAGVHLHLMGELGVRRPEPGVLHPERIKHLALEVVLPLEPRHDLDDRRTDIDAGVGIRRTRTRLEHDRTSRRDCRGLAKRSAARPAAATDVPLLRADLERKTARVVEAHADRQDILGLAQRADAVRLAVQDPQRLKLGQVLRDGIVQFDQPVLDQLRDRHAAEPLRLGTLHVDVVHLDRTLRLDVGIADAADLLDAVLVEDTDRAREMALLHIRRKGVLGERCSRIDGAIARTAPGEKRRADESDNEFIHSFHEIRLGP